MSNRAQVFHQATRYPSLAKYAGKAWAVLVVWPDTHRYFEFTTWPEALDFATTATRED